MKKTLDYHARLVVYGLPNMSTAIKKRLIRWLESTLKEFKKEKDYKVFSGRFRATLFK